MCHLVKKESKFVMIHRISRFNRFVTLLGGSKINKSVVAHCLTLAPDVVAVDGGADSALALGHMPLAVIGDMDSVTAAARETISSDRFFETPDQNRTDFDKALELVEAPLILGAGFMGGRADHELACYNTLVRHPDKPVILIGEQDICFHLSKPITLELPLKTRLSLFPMAQVVANAEGLAWPVRDLEFAPWDRTGTSNAVSDDPVRLRADGPGLLVILPRSALPQAINAVKRV